MHIIPVTDATWQTSHWQNELAQAIRDPQELLALLALPQDQLPPALAAAGQFSLRVPHSYVARMRKGDPADPLLKQILPVAQELTLQAEFTQDPVGDLAAMPTAGVLHKYHGRALLVTTGACAIHCRYCFRRHFPYSESHAQDGQWPAILNYLRQDTSISEVILSGGDPLTLSDQRLARLITALNHIPHLERLRIHSRLPVVLPSRINDELLATLNEQRLQPIMVIHANHANEIDEEVSDKLNKLRRSGITLLNQTVLLKDINNSINTLTELSQVLFKAGVLPYYLHLLDKVQGAAHFDVPLAEAQQIMHGLRQTLPGYLVPRLVREQQGSPYKLPMEDTAEQFQMP